MSPAEEGVGLFPARAGASPALLAPLLKLSCQKGSTEPQLGTLHLRCRLGEQPSPRVAQLCIDNCVTISATSAPLLLRALSCTPPSLFLHLWDSSSLKDSFCEWLFAVPCSREFYQKVQGSLIAAFEMLKGLLGMGFLHFPATTWLTVTSLPEQEGKVGTCCSARKPALSKSRLGLFQ